MIQANYYPPNGYPYEVCADFRGESTDTKPSDVSEGSTFHEWDTGNEYMFDGSQWLLQTSGGGGGGGSFGTPSMLIFCPIVGGSPDGENKYTYAMNIYKGEAPIAINAAGSVWDEFAMIASGLNVEVLPATNIPSSGTVGLYDFDMNEGTMTEYPDAVTAQTSGGNYESLSFTMPEVDPESHMVILGVTS